MFWLTEIVLIFQLAKNELAQRIPHGIMNDFQSVNVCSSSLKRLHGSKSSHTEKRPRFACMLARHHGKTRAQTDDAIPIKHLTSLNFCEIVYKINDWFLTQCWNHYAAAVAVSSFDKREAKLSMIFTPVLESRGLSKSRVLMFHSICWWLENWNKPWFACYI